MPRYTQLCTRCAWFGDIWAQPYHNPKCPACGGETERTWAKMPERVMITRDEIPGGVTLENYGHEPVTFYSHSERRAYMKAHGLQEMVRHVGVPGSDKSPYTTSWATSDPYTLEQARLLLERTGREPVTWDHVTDADVEVPMELLVSDAGDFRFKGDS